MTTISQWQCNLLDLDDKGVAGSDAINEVRGRELYIVSTEGAKVHHEDNVNIWRLITNQGQRDKVNAKSVTSKFSAEND